MRHRCTLTASGDCRTGRRVLIHRHAQIPDQQKHHGRLGQSGLGLRHSGRAALLEETSIAGEGYRSGPVLSFERPFGAPKFVCRSDSAGLN